MNFERHVFKVGVKRLERDEDLADHIKEPAPIRFVACNTRGSLPPDDLNTAIKKKINVKEIGSIQTEYVHGSWHASIQGTPWLKKAQGLKVSAQPDKNDEVQVSFRMRIQFGRRMVFFVLCQDPKSDIEDHLVHILTYGQYGGKILNTGRQVKL